jgi:hypothetical protein
MITEIKKMYEVYVTGTSRKGQNAHKIQKRSWSENYIKM